MKNSSQAIKPLSYSVLILLLIILAIPFTVFLSQQQQDIRQQAASYTCTLFIGYSQTNNWFPTLNANVNNPSQYEEQILFGGAAHNWIDPSYSGWSQPKSYPCAQNANTPDRVIFDVTHDDYLNNTSTYPDPVGTMEQIIRNLIPVIRSKYPSAQVIYIQPVTGGPNHTICRSGGVDVRASINHPYIHQAIDRVVNSGGGILFGNDSELGNCSQYLDNIGHLDDAGSAVVGLQNVSFFDPGTVITPLPTSGQATPTPTPTPTPLPGGAQVITFNDLPSSGILQGQYPTGVVNWGTNAWSLSGAYGGFSTINIAFNGQGPTSSSFSFLSPRRLISIDATNGGTAISTVTISCIGNTTKSQLLNPGQTMTIQTGFTSTCTAVTVGSSNGWDTNFDNFIHDGGIGGVTPVPTSTPIPPTLTPTPTRIPTATPTPTRIPTATPTSVVATPTPGSGKPGDLNGDGNVNIFDLSILLSNFGTTNPVADVNKDGQVNIFDLSILLTNFGT